MELIQGKSENDYPKLYWSSSPKDDWLVDARPGEKLGAVLTYELLPGVASCVVPPCARLPPDNTHVA